MSEAPIRLDVDVLPAPPPPAERRIPLQPVELSTPAPPRLPLGRILSFSLPVTGEGFMQMLMNLYLLKYTTDVLGLSPVAMGGIFLVSRVWDAISDPLVGFLSDQTKTRMGRRRPWMLLAAVPMAASFVLMWSAPASLSKEAVTLWVGASILLFYTCRTAFGVPHDSLAAELTTDYHDRTRLFGIRRAFFGVGAILVFVAVDSFLEGGESRSGAMLVASLAGMLTALAIFFMVWQVPEPLEHQGRGSQSITQAWRHVLQNRNARVLLGVFFLQQIGIGAVTMMAAYYAQYVLLDEGAFVRIMGSLFMCSVASIPLWIRLGKSFDKKTLMLTSMILVGGALSSLGFLGAGDLNLIWLIACVAGVASGGLDVLFPSIQADVIDSDELATGERKEGVYFASWHFASKTAVGISGVLAGFALEAAGFVPNVEQTETVKTAIRATMSAVPFVTYAAGIALFARFALTREAHREIRKRLDARHADQALHN